jgi:eukaryotic-like serine/threonine-protein kinase
VQLCADGRVVLTDFGIAYAGGTSYPGLSGSPAYLSPERARGDDIEPASDLFSLGATLFAAVEGRSPFGKADPFETLVAVVEDAPGPFVNAGPLRPLIDGLLAKNPASRLSVDGARTVLGRL